MQIKSKVKAGGMSLNHNEPAVRAGLRVRTRVRAGDVNLDHNERLLRS